MVFHAFPDVHHSLHVYLPVVAPKPIVAEQLQTAVRQPRKICEMGRGDRGPEPGLWEGATTWLTCSIQKNLFLLRYHAVGTISIITTAGHATLDAEHKSLQLLKPINVFNKSKGKIQATQSFCLKNIQLILTCPRFKVPPSSTLIWFQIVLLFHFFFFVLPQGLPMLKCACLVGHD